MLRPRSRDRFGEEFLGVGTGGAAARDVVLIEALADDERLVDEPGRKGRGSSSGDRIDNNCINIHIG